MPLPLLAIPAGLAVATAAGGGASIATILGSVLGGAAVGGATTGGVAWFVHKFFSDKDKKVLDKEKKVREHLEKKATEVAEDVKNISKVSRYPKINS